MDIRRLLYLGFILFLPLYPMERSVSGVQEAHLAQLILNHPEQGREQIVVNAILSQVARAKAKDMAERDYFSHTDPDGYGPNYRVEGAGYELPDWYMTSLDSNNIESLAGGQRSANEALEGFLESPRHRVHVLGTGGFFAEQEAIGIGFWYEEDARYDYYWVFVSAP